MSHIGDRFLADNIETYNRLVSRLIKAQNREAVKLVEKHRLSYNTAWDIVERAAKNALDITSGRGNF